MRLALNDCFKPPTIAALTTAFPMTVPTWVDKKKPEMPGALSLGSIDL
jgi:hypothetical protein